VIGSQNGRTLESNIDIKRLRLTYVVIAAIILIYIGRLFVFQILEGEAYAAQANDNRLDEVNVPAPRGVIYDRNGVLLVRNIPSFNVVITPALLPDSFAEQEAIFQELSDLTGVPLDQEAPPAARCLPGRGIRQFVEEGLTNGPYETWPIACNVDEEIARLLSEAAVDMPGVSVETEPVRDYTTGSLTATIIGYMGPIPETLVDYYEDLGFETNRDKVGYDGLELLFQNTLAGRNGRKEVERDVAGQVLREIGIVTQPVPGNSLRLTLDTRLQAVAETALRREMDFINNYSGERRTPLGVAIAINPQTGEILAMVSLPTYENNRMARVIPGDYYLQLAGDERGKPLVNHAIADEFPPGSTFKLVTATGALNEGVITVNQLINDPGLITIENRYFPTDPGLAKDFVCWKEDGHGDISFVEGIAESCNVYFYKIGGGYPGEVPEGGLGILRMQEYAYSLGYGAPLGIDLPSEEDGLIPDPEWKRIALGESWSTGDTYNSVVGQGFVAATPLQVLNSAATIANGGRVMWPHIVSEVLDGEGNVVQTFEPCVLWDLTDGVITPLEDIGADCPTLPERSRTIIIQSRTQTPDLQVDPEVISYVQQGMRMVVTQGTAFGYAELENIPSAGKTGTGEFCDELAFTQGLCEPGNWPTHSWYVAYAPYENPEIAVIAFVYNGGEGAVTAGPIVQTILEAYFELKEIDSAAEAN
jgi:penicillin-binding protein 2